MENQHSAEFYNLQRRWNQGRITESMLRKYVQTGRITPEEFTEITDIIY